MMKRVRSRVLIPAGTVVLLVAAGFSALQDELLMKLYRGIDLFGKVYKEVATNYVDEIDPDKFMKAGINGMLKTLDPYTIYIDDRDHGEIDLVTTGKYGGVGITVGIRDGAITVVGLMEGFSAAKYGLRIGDRLVAIDSVSLAGKSFDEVRGLVRGEPGSEVRMTIEREGESGPLEFVLLREEIPVRNVSYAGMVEEGIGYIRLERFSRTAGEDVRQALKGLLDRGTVRGIVLDLRNNPGGLLDMAVEVASKFLPESSLVVSTRGRRADSERRYRTTGKPLAPELPLAVLVDRGTASASEIVAGAIQDLDRGVIVGSRTFGKGLIQTIIRVSETTSLKITTGRYYTPSGRSIQEIDYFHRKDNGEVRILPDSLRREFRTIHNRSVYEAGGIRPDTLVEPPAQSALAAALMDKAMFFKFANRYALTHSMLEPGFTVTPELYREFKAFVHSRGFTLKEEARQRLEDVKQAAGKAGYGKDVLDHIQRLEQLIEREQERAFERHEEEVKRLLALEIIGRIAGERQQIVASLKDDPQLAVAVNLVKGRRMYNQILSGTGR
ncbi:MAG: carboxyl-terminal processing protease [Bacteroidia bacterium]|nr:MAG: carboxyl-terminal processing protease [Bacteroidia bacterium]